jgi:WD40 repeat protein
MTELKFSFPPIFVSPIGNLVVKRKNPNITIYNVDKKDDLKDVNLPMSDLEEELYSKILFTTNVLVFISKISESYYVTVTDCKNMKQISRCCYAKPVLNILINQNRY